MLMVAKSNRSLVTISLTLALAGVMQGCGTTPVSGLVSSPLPVPASYPQVTGDNTAKAAPDVAWEQVLPDPRFQKLMALALENSRDLRLASLRVEEARAAWGIQRADLFPSIGATAGGNRARVPGDINLTGQSLITSQYQVGLGMNQWELDLWGRVRSLNEAALQRYLSADEMRRAATLSLFSQLAQGWLGLVELDERLTLARAEVASRQETLRIFTRRFEVGAASKFDLEQVRVLSTQADMLVAQLEQQRAQQINGLTLLAGSPVADIADGVRLDNIVVAEIGESLPSELLTARPDILAAERDLLAADANVSAARAAFFPSITLTASAGTASAELGGLFDAGSRAWSWAPSITLPIFTAGRLRASLDVAQLRREQAVASYEKNIQSAFRDVADALAARQWLAQQLKAQEAALAAQRERARLATLRYDAGSSTFLDVLDARRDLLTAEQQRAQLQRALLSARVAVFAALGGGSGVLESAGGQ
ncbi:MAG: efflux transporter outer membrane subunit [Gallionellaceae bacterium]|jgi:multidrug efflux system outer membrane protein|nr:efflux transporter outer membrane subunit [Gallionellaceae bacterium]